MGVGSNSGGREHRNSSGDVLFNTKGSVGKWNFVVGRSKSYAPDHSTTEVRYRCVALMTGTGGGDGERDVVIRRNRSIGFDEDFRSVTLPPLENPAGAAATLLCFPLGRLSLDNCWCTFSLREHSTGDRNVMTVLEVSLHTYCSDDIWIHRCHIVNGPNPQRRPSGDKSPYVWELLLTSNR